MKKQVNMKFDEETVKELEAIRIAFGFKSTTRAAEEAIHRLGWPFVDQSMEAMLQIQKSVGVINAITSETLTQIVSKVKEEEKRPEPPRPDTRQREVIAVPPDVHKKIKSAPKKRKSLYKDTKRSITVTETSQSRALGTVETEASIDGKHWAPDEYSQ